MMRVHIYNFGGGFKNRRRSQEKGWLVARSFLQRKSKPSSCDQSSVKDTLMVKLMLWFTYSNNEQDISQDFFTYLFPRGETPFYIY